MEKELFIKNNEGNTIIGTTYEKFNKDYKLQLEIYDLHHSKKGYKIYCGCNEKPIHMYIARNKNKDDDEDTIYLVNYDGQGTKHSDLCSYNREYNYINDREKGWEEDKNDNGKFVVNLSKDLIELSESSPENNKISRDYKALYSGNGSSGSPHQVTIYGLASRFILINYRKHLQNKGKHPDNINEFLKYSYGQANAITMKTKSKRSHRKTLNDVWYKGKEGAHVGSSRFVLREFDSFSVTEDELDKDYYMIRAKRPQDNAAIDNIGRVKKDVFNQVIKTNKIHGVQNFKNGGKILLSGFIQKKEDSYGYIYWEFVSITLLNVTKTGLLVDSGKETTAYHKAIDENIPFYKPEGPLSYYNDWIPDMLFMRPLNPGKVYIGEIFGFNSDDYYDRTQEKIKFVEDSSTLDMWAWFANQHDETPNFY